MKMFFNTHKKTSGISPITPLFFSDSSPGLLDFILSQKVVCVGEESGDFTVLNPSGVRKVGACKAFSVKALSLTLAFGQ